MLPVARLVPEGSILRRTTLALVAPRRLVPILAITAPLVAAQHTLSHDRLAVPLAIAMAVAGILVGPVSWRVLFPDGIGARALTTANLVRLSLFASIGAGVVLTLGAVVPKVLDMGDTLLTERPSLVVCAALFLVGGWGLGRDIGFEVDLARVRARADALEREAERVQLLALRAHLDPHFLFNTLNAIAEWCREDGETAERAVLALSSMLRAMLAGVASPAWPLAKELELVRSLFDLHRLRDPARFAVELALPEPLPDVAVPPLLLLPLAENAVKHGPGAGHRGVIRLTIADSSTAEEARCRVTLENPGPYHGPRAGSSGLPTVEKRLALAYRGAARSTIESVGGDAVDERTRVVVELPRAPIDGVVT